MKTLIDGHKMLVDAGEHLINKDPESLLKTCVVNIDGYEVVIQYNKYYVDSMYQICIQFYSYKSMTLPKNLVFKCARLCLGDIGLNYEISIYERLIFSFFIFTDLEGVPMEVNEQNCEYDGIKFTNINLMN